MRALDTLVFAILRGFVQGSISAFSPRLFEVFRYNKTP